MFFNTIGLLLVLLFFVYSWIKKRFCFWKDRGFPQGDPTFPLGTLQGVGTTTTISEKLGYYYNKFKGKAPAVGLYNFLSPIILPLDPELIKNILVRDFQSFHDRGFYYNKEDDPISTSILTLDGQDWRDRRVKLSPIFTSGKMKMMFEIVDEISDKFVQVLEEEMSKADGLEMRSWTQRFTTDTIGNVAFGIEPNFLEDKNSEFGLKSRKIFDISFFENLKFAFSTGFPSLARKLHLRLVPKDVGDYFLKTFKNTIQWREDSSIVRNDFVNLLLTLKDVYTMDELAAEAFVVFTGGFETSSTLMTFLLYELALNPDIQDRLREEITTGIVENGGKLSYDLVHSFKYLDMVINEGLRKYPPIPVQFRKCTNDYHIPSTELIIPKGTVIQINAYSVHHDPEYFPDPEKFDPERFNAENIENIRPLTNIPFSDGPRNCIGKRFGLMQSKIGIAKLIKNFIFTPCKNTPMPVKFLPANFFLAPVGGMWLKTEKVS